MYNTDQLVEDHAAAVYRFCRSLAFSKEEAEDLFQETFLQACKNVRKIRTSPEGFLMATAFSVYKSYQRKIARRNRIAPTVMPGDIFAGLHDGISDGSQPLEDFISAEEAGITRGLVNGLPDKYRLPIVLHYSAELSVADIATILKIPQGTVKRRLHTARGLIKEGLVKYGY